MAARFTYSRWDGARRGFDFDAESLFDQLTDELLYHGDVNAALRRMMQQGMRDPNGERLQGLRELMTRVREERQQRLDRHDLGGVYDEINRELDDIVDEERHAVDNAERDARDERRRAPRADSPATAAADRQMQLDLMPDDLAGKVRELSTYDVRVERGAAALRAADGAAARAADAAGRRPDDARAWRACRRRTCSA